MSLKRSIGATSAASATSAIAAFLVSILLARLVGPAGQGLVNLVTTSAGLVTLVGVAGTGLALRLRSKGDPAAKDFHAFSAFTLSAAPLAAVIALIVTLVLHRESWTQAEVVAIATYGLFAFLARQTQEGIQALGDVARAIWGVVTSHAVNASFLVAAILYAPDSLLAALWAAAGGQIAQVFIGIMLTRGPQRDMWRPVWSGRRVATLLRIGIPSLGYGLGLFALQRADRLLLVSLSSPSAAGLYAVASSVGEAGRLLTAPIGQQLFVRVTASGYDAATRRAYWLVLAMQALPLAAMVLLADPIIPAVFGAPYQESAQLLQWLALAEFFMGAALLDSRILMGLRGPKMVSVITLAVVPLSLAAYLIFIPRYETLGAVGVTCVTYIVYSLALRAAVVQTEPTTSRPREMKV
ncbi:lipopolysaccharide biosynthesis protein [Kytococcus sedentarius]|uniref:lipopolysaccharide biosynthesis protein n=1 Tax=Kytococcus sedentarius TaxID=1276 RepID=UPI00384D886F